ncbi:uncharacterized protein Z520_05007 [Fonsecaea multimorphosa CBS 102226]|uniref:Phenazine biosynthesis protein n=1 Tax=Fonsecaea multimorphosa CBS 102226 TaxID=1442371 RepID=A0A0D2IR33_9EURO|nr:uncharacterized protein Z520_05007 [Fonsecaea multimorphosa CBS 102226]KIX99431.1 hypothetical protein Z520_05007 [Fonsecaea multimorphosa CBS 102226]OAL25758.1 hypothetical protein AYO22_04747 [Fonsecaea multimorphosa]
MPDTSRDDAIHLVNVFTSDTGGGNLAPIVLRAEGLTDEDMRGLARKHERESAFVLPPPPPSPEDGSDVDFQLRFFVPEHEMEMCGHATVGTAWAMHELGVSQKPELRFTTKSGPVRTVRRVERGDGLAAQKVKVFVSQPKGTVEDVVDGELVAEVLSVLGITEAQLQQTTPRPVRNACTSRVKTTVALRSADVLNSLRPDFSRVRDLCEKLGSTGLYPYAIVQPGSTNSASGGQLVQVEARQFPKASGYPEDAATGIAAAALSYALAANGVLGVGQEAVVYQGRAMGYPSQINVLLEEDGCWVGGTCAWEHQST